MQKSNSTFFVIWEYSIFSTRIKCNFINRVLNKFQTDTLSEQEKKISIPNCVSDKEVT